MMSEDVPEEWVLAAWNGWVAGKHDGMHGEAMRAALAAVAPLIRRAALEEAAGVAENKAASLDKLGADIAKRAVVGAHPYLVRATDARDIAAAIRALGT
jgi:hypothetical protein